MKDLFMKKKTGKRIRYVRLAGVLLALGVLAIAAYGSFGAYTNFNSVKRVVSTGTQTSDTMFSSNYLSLLNSVDTNLRSNVFLLLTVEGINIHLQ